MKFFTCFKRMNQVGAAVVEYAVILAFVAAVGSSFTDNISPRVNNIIKSVSSMLGLAANGSEMNKNVAAGVFKSLDGSRSDGDIRYCLGKEIVSGGGRFFESILKEDNIETAYMFTNYSHLEDTDVLYSSGLLPAGVNTNYVKLITIADTNGINPTKGTQLSATQYLVYSDKNVMHVAATRHLTDVTIDSEGPHKSGTFKDSKTPETAYSNKYDFSGGHYTKNGPPIDLKNVGEGFVKYTP